MGDNRYAGETWIAGGKGFCCGDDEWADFYCGSQDSFRDVYDNEGSLHDDNEGSLHDSGEGLAIDNDGDALESRNDALVSNNAKSAVLEEKLEPQDEVNANANVWVTGI